MDQLPDSLCNWMHKLWGFSLWIREGRPGWLLLCKSTALRVGGLT
jgi:hypothetical protein